MLITIRMRDVVCLLRKGILPFFMLLVGVLNAQIVTVKDVTEFEQAISSPITKEIYFANDLNIVLNAPNDVVRTGALKIDGGNHKVTISYENTSVALFEDNPDFAWSLTLRNLVIENSKGTIANLSGLNFLNCVIRNNELPSNTLFYISNGSSAFIDSCLVDGNKLSSFLECDNRDLNLRVENSEFRENTTDNGVFYVQDIKNIKVNRVTFAENTSSTSGAAINYRGFFKGEILSVYNSTFYKNTAADKGGAISFVLTDGGVPNKVELKHVTAYENTASSGNGSFLYNGGIDDVTVAYSIIYNSNSEPGVVNGNKLIANYIDESIPPELTNLGYVSGVFGRVMVPLEGKNMVDKITDVTNVAPEIEDQVGNDRILGASMDYGSVEYKAPPKIDIGPISEIAFCSGQTVYFTFNSQEEFFPGNRFDIYLMNLDDGSEIIVDTTNTLPSFSFGITIPADFAKTSTLNAGIRITSTSPQVINSDTLKFEVYTVPDVSVSSNLMVDCFGGTIDVSSSVQSVTPIAYYTWWEEPESRIKEGVNVTELQSQKRGDYYLTVRDTNTCEGVVYFTITEPKELKVIKQIVDSVTCFDKNDGKIALHASGGTRDYTYRLTGLSNTLTKVVDSVFTGLKPDSYTLDITDDNGCSIYDGQLPPIVLDVKKGLKEDASWLPVTKAYCETGDSVKLEGFLIQGVTSLGVFSSNTKGVYQNVFYPDSTGAGLHEVTYTTVKCEIDSTQLISVYKKVEPKVVFTTDTIICESTIDLAVLTVSNEGGNTKYYWEKNGDLSVTTTEPSVELSRLELVTGDKIRIVMEHNDACISGGSSFVSSNELQFAVRPRPDVKDLGNIKEVSAGHEASVPILNINNFDSFYEFSVTLGQDESPQIGEWRIVQKEINYKADHYSLQKDSIDVSINEKKCNVEFFGKLRVQPINEIPEVILDKAQVEIGDVLSLNLKEYVVDNNDNIYWNEIEVVTASTKANMAMDGKRRT